jgi:valyl-tRNA synthetase
MSHEETHIPPAESKPEPAGSNLPKAYDPSIIEQRWADYWVRERLFDVPTPATNPGGPRFGKMWDEESNRVPIRPTGGPCEAGKGRANAFTMLLPPPNVTGRLHMGHMLNQTEMDILTRWHRMRGETALWVPGTDHAGIATQMMVERQLAAEGTHRKDLGRDAFTERVWAWKRQYGSAITDQMRRLGASVDWSREYFTMDDRLSVAVKEAFVRLYEQGLIYRGSYIVNWDPIQQTAVSDLEVTHEDRAGKLYHIRYPFADGTGSIVIATTRPETLLGDTAVAVNPDDARYKAFVGKLVTLPLTAANGNADREIPILADEWAQPEFGTGAVKVTPAHDPNDFAIGQRHSLPSLTIMDETAHIDLPGSPYHGLDRFEARTRIVADLEAAGLLVDIKDHSLAIAISQRSGAVIEPRLSLQWFLAVNKAPQTPGAPFVTDSSSRVGSDADSSGPRKSIAQTAIDAVQDGHIKFTPDMYQKTYMEWMTNIHDWCISRQLWWGHRIPAWHCNACGKITVSRHAVDACSGCGITDIRQETDVLDTWFSSGLLPFTVFGWPGTTNKDCHSDPERSEGEESPHPANAADSSSGEAQTSNLTPDLAAFYPTSLLVTGFDILFFWVARMIMLGTHFMLDVPLADGSPRTLADAVPFREVYIHALVRDANREKMSKTKGNVIDPIEIITKYGTDAVRFTLASQASPGTDIAFNEARTEGYRAFANKIWNAARFLFMNLDRAREAGYNVTLSKEAITSTTRDAITSTTRDAVTSTTQEAVTSTTQEAVTSTTQEAITSTTREAVISTGETDTVRLGAERPPHFAGAATILTELPDHPPLETRWIFARLHSVSAEVDRALNDYRFDEAANAIYQFFWGEFCDWYLELVKLRLNFDIPVNDDTAVTLAALTSTFEAALRLLSPFMPFLTEEIWHALYNGEPPAKSIALTRYPQPADFPTSDLTLAAMATMQELITTIRALRKELSVPEKEATPIALHAGARVLALTGAHADMLGRLARVSAIEFSTEPLTGNNARSTPSFDVAVVYERQIDIPAERERLTKDLAKHEKNLTASEARLGNEAFMAKAPAHIVEGLRKQAAETRTLYDKTKSALDALPPS